MEDYEVIEKHTDRVHGVWPWAAWDRIIAREKGDDTPPTERDFEAVGWAISREPMPPDVDAAWCRIVARERARMGLPDLDTERSPVVLYLAEVESATADDLVNEGLYAQRGTANVMLATLAKQGRIRRVSAGVYAWGGGA